MMDKNAKEMIALCLSRGCTSEYVRVLLRRILWWLNVEENVENAVYCRNDDRRHNGVFVLYVGGLFLYFLHPKQKPRGWNFQADDGTELVGR